MTGKPQGNLQLGKLRKLQALRKSTAHGRKPSDAAKTPPTQPQEKTSKLESDMLTHSPRVQNPEGEAVKGGAALAQGRKPSGLSGHLYQDTPNPMLNVHCRSRSANQSQLGVEPKKGSQLHDTQRKTAGAPGKMQSSHTKRGSARAYPTPSRRRGRHSTAATERNPTHIYRDHQRWWPAAKTHQASYRRRERRGE